jgi:hypothetical protein
LAEADAATYKRWYKHVDIANVDTSTELMALVEGGSDIIHLTATVASGGWLTGGDHPAQGTDLISKCGEYQVKLLWIASENSPEQYISGFRASGKRLNLVMTISRNGDSFTGFLDGLLSRISQGTALPNAWTAMAPQTPGRARPDLPSCIFFAGWPDARLT